MEQERSTGSVPTNECRTKTEQSLRGLNVVHALRSISSRVDGDYDLTILYLTIASLSVEVERPDLIVVRGVTLPELIANVGRPRETVRRKLLQLMEAGFVERTDRTYRVKDIEFWSETLTKFEPSRSKMEIAVQSD